MVTQAQSQKAAAHKQQQAKRVIGSDKLEKHEKKTGGMARVAGANIANTTNKQMDKKQKSSRTTSADTITTVS